MFLLQWGWLHGVWSVGSLGRARLSLSCHWHFPCWSHSQGFLLSFLRCCSFFSSLFVVILHYDVLLFLCPILPQLVEGCHGWSWDVNLSSSSLCRSHVGFLLGCISTAGRAYFRLQLEFYVRKQKKVSDMWKISFGESRRDSENLIEPKWAEMNRIKKNKRK